MRDEMKKPDFFIIGAPKCGTTALYRYLKDHPQIYFSELKEPHYFNEEDEGRHIKDLETYLKLFAGASEQYKAVGEASVLYLRSRSAVQKIMEFNPAARLIVMLRHPVDMYLSLHQQNLFRFRENVMDPEQAWNLQAARAEGNRIPKGALEPGNLQYREVCGLGMQLERLFAIVPKRQVYVISFNDFQENTAAVYQDVLAFLGIDPDGRTEFPRENSAKMHRSFLLARLLGVTAFFRRSVFADCVSKSRSSHELEFWLKTRKCIERLREMNTKPYRLTVNSDFVNRLNREMACEVVKIKELTGLELKSTYRVESTEAP
jgi:hypothetical protein